MFATLDLPLRDDNRHKRLKVGRACHPCRMKKIKCDGKQPCMQCKARRRKCMYLKNTDATYIKMDPDESLLLQEPNENSIIEAANVSSSSLSSSSSPSLSLRPLKEDQLFQLQGQPSNTINSTMTTRSDKMMEQLTQGLVQLTVHQDASKLNKASSITPWRHYGDFVRWSSEPSLPTLYSGSLDMPSRTTQEYLIQVFFTHCHTLLPIMTKRMFYDQLQNKGPLITPLLLNMIYAHASAHQQSTASQPPPPPLGLPPSSSVFLSSPQIPIDIDSDTFYRRARLLLDDFMDTPRISTVIALLYMVSYEDNVIQQKQKQQQHYRSGRAWMYSGMAIRMCLELGLHTAHYSSQMSQFDIELRKRVLWTCYVMDKLESCTMERPWMLRSQDIALDLPTVLPEDDQQERNVLDGFAHLCRLMMLVEKVLAFFTYDVSSSMTATNNGEWSTKEETQILYFLDQLSQWRDLLPEELQWRPLDVSIPGSAIVANLHLLSYDLELSLVLCCRFQLDQVQCGRRRSVANTITHLVMLTVQHPHLMYNPAISAFSGIFASLAHASDVGHILIEVAKDAEQQFKLSLEVIRDIMGKLPMHNMQQFIGLIDTFLRPSSSSITAPKAVTITSTTNISPSPSFPFISSMPSSISQATNTDNGTSSSSSSSSSTPSVETMPTTTHNFENSKRQSSVVSDQEKWMQRVLGTHDIYEAQMLAKTLRTMQQHQHHHDRAFPTPFTTPSPPPSTHPEITLTLDESPQVARKPPRPPISSSSPSSSSSTTTTAPSSPSTSNTSLMPGTTSYLFSSQAAEAAAAAAVGAVGTPLINHHHPQLHHQHPQQHHHHHHQQQQLSMMTNTPTSSTSAALMVPSITIPTQGGPLKNIEPADYTFELISVDDEWAKSLLY